MEADEVKPPQPLAPSPLYENDLQQPSADAPLRDLPPDKRPIFKAIRNRCLAIPGVTENVRHDGAHWKWVWAYEREGFTLCVLHPMKDGVDLSFPIAQRWEPAFEKADLDKTLTTAVSKGPTAARVRYVRVGIADESVAEIMFRGVELKLKLIAEEASPGHTNTP